MSGAKQDPNTGTVSVCCLYENTFSLPLCPKEHLFYLNIHYSSTGLTPRCPPAICPMSLQCLNVNMFARLTGVLFLFTRVYHRLCLGPLESHDADFGGGADTNGGVGSRGSDGI